MRWNAAFRSDAIRCVQTTAVHCFKRPVNQWFFPLLHLTPLSNYRPVRMGHHCTETACQNQNVFSERRPLIPVLTAVRTKHKLPPLPTSSPEMSTCRSLSYVQDDAYQATDTPDSQHGPAHSHSSVLRMKRGVCSPSTSLFPFSGAHQLAYFQFLIDAGDLAQSSLNRAFKSCGITA